MNGIESELEPSGAKVGTLPDRLVIHGSNGAETALSIRAGDRVLVSFRGQTFEVEKATAAASKKLLHSTGESHAPMPGQVVELFVEEGTQVALGQKLLVLEAMKMQHTMTAPFAGKVTSVPVRKGDQVSEGQLLASVEPDNEQLLQQP